MGTVSGKQYLVASAFFYEGLCKVTAGISKAAFSDYLFPYFLKLYPIRFLILKLTLPLAGEGQLTSHSKSEF